jgi:hypothetical protein
MSLSPIDGPVVRQRTYADLPVPRSVPTPERVKDMLVPGHQHAELARVFHESRGFQQAKAGLHVSTNDHPEPSGRARGKLKRLK